MSDPWPGWEKCETCDGGGTFEILCSGFPPEPCLDCAHGYVPPAYQVVAAARALWNNGVPLESRELRYPRKAARAALIAAARKQYA